MTDELKLTPEEREIVKQSQELFDKLRKEFESEHAGQKFWINPVCHGDRAFASWEYQLWLEMELIKSRAHGEESVASPSGVEKTRQEDITKFFGEITWQLNMGDIGRSDAIDRCVDYTVNLLALSRSTNISEEEKG
jgi:hypothetical protein